MAKTLDLEELRKEIREEIEQQHRERINKLRIAKIKKRGKWWDEETHYTDNICYLLNQKE